MALDQNQYAHAMTEDPTTGKPMPKSEVVISGSYVKQTIISALAITDTAAKTGTGVDVSSFQNVAIRARNTHNQPLTLYVLRGDTSSDSSWTGNKDNVTYSVTLPASMTKESWITPTEMPILKFVQYANVSVVAGTAPTSGSVTVEVIGRK